MTSNWEVSSVNLIGDTSSFCCKQGSPSAHTTVEFRTSMSRSRLKYSWSRLWALGVLCDS